MAYPLVHYTQIEKVLEKEPMLIHGHCLIVFLNDQRSGISKIADMEIWGRVIWVDYLE